MATAETENARVVKAIYGGWSGSKGAGVDDVGRYIAEDVQWRSLADGRPGAAFTAARSGRDAALAYLFELTANWSMNYYEVKNVITEGDFAVVIADISWTNKKSQKTFEGEKVDVIRFSDGKIAEFSEYYDTIGLIEASQ